MLFLSTRRGDLVVATTGIGLDVGMCGNKNGAEGLASLREIENFKETDYQ